MKIGNINIEPGAALAPMAGVTDRAFRGICKNFGAVYMVGEMASAKALTMNDRKTEELLAVEEKQRPFAIQLFGSEPEDCAQACKKVLAFKPDCIDLNMGCPAPKIVKGGSGSALMKQPALAGQIIQAVCKASTVPVTVKFRTGWDEQSINCVEFAKLAEQSGAAAITIHGRTREQMYSPPVDLEQIKRVKEAVAIPVIGNGDIFSALDAKKMLEYTGCDMVMVGRGAQGNPWIFSQIRHYMQTGELLPLPPIQEKMEVLKKHIALLCKYKGEYIGMKEARKHAAWYLKGMHGAASLRREMSSLKCYEDLEKLIEQILQHNMI